MATECTSSSIVIRSYQPSDLSACQTIFMTVHRDYGNPSIFTGYVLQTDMADIEKNYLQIPNGHWWVAVSADDHRVVGEVAVLPLHLGDPVYYSQLPVEQRDQVCELRRMAIASDAQRQGVGSELLSALIDFARKKGYHQVHLTTLNNMERACAFYEKHGFIRGRIERFPVEIFESMKLEDLPKFLNNLPKPFIFEVGADIPDEDRRLMKMPPNQSKFMYVQHFSLML